VLDTKVDKNCEEYLSNYDAMQLLNIELDERVHQTMFVMSDKERAKLSERSKLTPRQRI